MSVHIHLTHACKNIIVASSLLLDTQVNIIDISWLFYVLFVHLEFQKPVIFGQGDDMLVVNFSREEVLDLFTTTDSRPYLFWGMVLWPWRKQLFLGLTHRQIRLLPLIISQSFLDPTQDVGEYNPGPHLPMPSKELIALLSRRRPQKNALCLTRVECFLDEGTRSLDVRH